MAQIYVNSGLVKPKAIHIYNSSAQLWEEDRIGYVRVNGEWVPFITYLLSIYDNGIENPNIPLVMGYYALGDVDYRFTKEPAKIYLYNRHSDPYTTFQAFSETGVLVDLTDFSTVHLVFENQYGFNAMLAVANEKRTRYNDNIAEATSRDVSGNLILDVSSLSGSYYIKSGIYQSGVTQLRFYINKLWLE